MERKRTCRGKTIKSNVARAKDLTERGRKQTKSQKNIPLHRGQSRINGGRRDTKSAS